MVRLAAAREVRVVTSLDENPVMSRRRELRVPIDHVKPADVITVHGSQGAEADVVVVVLPKSAARMVDRNFLYTAESRAKKKLYLVGDRNNFDNRERGGYVRNYCTAMQLEHTASRVESDSYSYSEPDSDSESDSPRTLNRNSIQCQNPIPGWRPTPFLLKKTPFLLKK